MKRLTALILALLMLFCLAACGGDASNATAGENEKPEADKQDYVSEETVLVDNEYCKFTVKSFEDEGYEYVMHVELENKSETGEMFSVDYVTVNGWALDPFWAEAVAPGMKANSEICWSAEALEKSGIEDVLCISFVLSVCDEDDWLADSFVEETFSVYPTGDEDFTPTVRKTQSGDIVLIENDDCSVVVTGFDPDNMWGYTMNLYIYNKTDKVLMFSMDDVAVNGYMCDPFWANSIAGGAQEMVEISWSETDFEDNGITEVEEISTVFNVSDYDTFDTLFEDTFVINP